MFYHNGYSGIRYWISICVIAITEEDDAVSLLDKHGKSVSEGDVTKASDNSIDKEDEDGRS